ncbi:SGNH hydrolase domain-containing protein, partial [Enterobacter roggenkampii]|uniref:SGNH hydrolase domain-containing protein n=1 Tax=Enterobacter roggenkampii TaxID=1812935 RepID=UPI003BC59446
QVSATEHTALSRFTDDIFAGLTDVTILDPANDLCRDTACDVERDGRLLYFDDNHLSAVGARGYAPELGAMISRELAKAGDRKP